ncbi:MAG: DUF4837 family protein [Candidatus Cloacimonetes bacterium]|nr:DUF4837 family protein [Candidatus Cloacimonadota bacterium]
MKKIYLFSTLLILLLLITGCNKQEKEVVQNMSQQISNKPLSWGKDQVIYIFADQELWQTMEADIRENLERTFVTTGEEALFEIELADIKKMDDYYKFRNLLFIADISDNEPVAQYVNTQLQSDLVEQVKKDGFGFYYKADLWARDQIVCFLLSDNLTQMKALHQNLKDVIFNQYRNALRNRIKTMYSHKVTKSDEIFNELPYEISIPKQFTIYKDWKDKNIMSFLYRHYKEKGDKPDKYITIYYEKADKNPISEEWLFKARSRIGWDVYDKDEIKADQVKIELFEWNEIKGLRLFGRWSNFQYIMGGAFQSYAFWDEKTKTAYLIDNSIFFPAGDKLYYMMEMEAISQTIHIK